MTLQELIDIDRVQKLQNKFCEVVKTNVYCVQEWDQPVTKISGNQEDINRLSELVTAQQVRSLVQRVSGNSIEDQAVEDTEYPWLKLAAASVKVTSQVQLTWIIYGIVYDVPGADETELRSKWHGVIREKQLYRALDLLHDVSYSILRNKARLESVRAESLRSRYSQQVTEELLHQNESMTQVVQLLDYEEAIEVVMEKMLAIIGGYLHISSAQVFKLHDDRSEMDVIAEWRNTGVISYFDRTKNQPTFQFLHTDKPLVLSYDSDMPVSVKEELKRMQISALISFPVFFDDVADMYVCFQDKTPTRRWQVEEIKFINDSLKVLQSILTRRIQKNSLTSSYNSLAAVLDNVGSAIYVKDEINNEVLFENRILRNTFHKELHEHKLEDILKKERSELFHEETGHWYDLLHHKIKWVNGRDVSLYVLYDITDKKNYQYKIEQQAYTDFLTGLYNRMCCERDLARFIDEAKKNGGKGALLYLDLDDFKHINDGLGHQYGDVLLKSISESLSSINGIHNTCYRMGGDEFVIIVPSTEEDKLEQILNNVQGIFSKPWFLKNTDFYCTMSMGVVYFPEYGDDVQEMIKKADIAMYEAKRAGKNQVAYYSDSINSSSMKRLDMEKNMRDATKDGFDQFEVYFQPIMNIHEKGNPCVGAEALIRWNSDKMGFISPTDFIPLAEYLGLITPIGNHVLYEACKACKWWNDHGKPNYKVNVNLSVVQLLQTDIVSVIAQTIRQTGIDPHHLTLEVTESLAINDMPRMQKILGAIKDLGARLALDDFGTGYSSLNHIREIPFDVIKVDQGFVKDLAEDAYSQAFVKMVGELAETLDKSICVEGIETESQLRVLENMNVLMVQGYYFGKPMPRKDFEAKYVS